jgi:hypothetical protein
MVIKGEPRNEDTGHGIVEFRESMSTLANGAYDELTACLRSGKGIKRAHPDGQGSICGSETHRLLSTNMDIVKREYPRAEWHYVRLKAYPICVFVATEGGLPVALAAPVTSFPEQDKRRIDKWSKRTP